MKASTRIEYARRRLQAVAALPAEPPEQLLDELRRCLAVEVENLLTNYDNQSASALLIKRFVAMQRDELPVSDFAIIEFKRSVNQLPMMTNPKAFIERVASAVHPLIVYQLGWSKVIEDVPLQAWYSEQLGEIIISGVGHCTRLSGEKVAEPGTLRAATKSELLAQGLYVFHAAHLD